MLTFLHLIDKMSTKIGQLFSWLIVVLTAVIVFEVFTRYAFNHPNPWVFDASYILYGILFMMAGAYTLSKGGHVRGDILYGFFSPRTQASLDLILYFVFFFPGIIALTQGSYMGQPMMELLQQSKFRQKTLEVAERRVKNELVLKDRAQGLVEDLDYLKFAIANFPEYQQLAITPLRLSQTKVSAGFSKNSVLFKQKQQLVQAIAELDTEGLWFSELP